MIRGENQVNQSLSSVTWSEGTSMWTRAPSALFGGAHFTGILVSRSDCWIARAATASAADHALFAIDDQLRRKDVAVPIARRRLAGAG